MIRTLVVAPGLAARAGLHALLNAEADIEVFQEAGSLAELEEIPRGTDVVVLTTAAAARPDLEEVLPGQENPVGLLLVGEVRDPAQILAGLALRGWGLLPPDAAPEELAAAVRAIHAGLVVGTPGPMEALLLRQFLADPGEAVNLVEPLTEREIQVLGLLASGLANKQIAAELEISEHTVKFHVSSIYAKLGATNRAEAVRLGARQGLIVL